MRIAARVILVAAVAFTGGCAVSSDREVFLRMPVSRLDLPEVGDRYLSSGPGLAGFERVTLTKDQTTTSPNPGAPQFGNDDNELRANFDGALSPWMAISGVVYGEGQGMLKAKLIPLQQGRFSGAVSLGFGEDLSGENQDFVYNADSNLYSTTHVEGHLVDGALIFGWRASTPMLLYGGPYYTRLSYHGHYFSSRGSNPDIDEDFGGDVSQLGANVGVAYRLASWARLLGEYAEARFTGGDSRKTDGRFSFTFQFEFGPRMTPVLREPERPIEVVPPVKPDSAG